MLLSEVIKLIEAEVVSKPTKNDPDIIYVGAFDLMSDALAYSKRNMLLITGLTSNQSVRTAQILDCPAVLYVRGKKPPTGTIEMADSMDLILLHTDKCLFKTCVLLSCWVFHLNGR